MVKSLKYVLIVVGIIVVLIVVSMLVILAMNIGIVRR
jgi:hypothetical protein